MTTSLCNAEAATPRPDPVEAVASFFREDPARILAVASSLRGPDRALESTVEGMSMGRTIPPGSRIRIALVDRHGYDVGEVVAFLAASKVVVHRIVHRGRRGAARGHLLTRGDSALVPDPPVDAGRVLGAVTAIHRGGRWIPLDRRPRRSFPARIVTSLTLAVVACVLQASPRAAETLVRLLHRGWSLHSACLRRAGRPTGS